MDLAAKLASALAPAPSSTLGETLRRAQTTTAALSGLRESFGGDLDKLLIYLAAAQVQLDQAVRDERTGGGANALQLAEITGVSRETTRRKVQALVQEGFLDRPLSDLYRVKDLGLAKRVLMEIARADANADTAPSTTSGSAWSDRDRNAERAQVASRISGAAMLEWDLTTGLFDWDEAVWDLLGLDRVRERPSLPAMFRHIAPADRARLGDAVEAARQGRGDLDLEFQVRAPGAQERTLKLVGQTTADAAGLAQRMVAALADITPWRAISDDQSMDEALLETLLGLSQEAVLVTDPQGRITRIGASAAAFGLDRTQDIGRSLAQALRLEEPGGRRIDPAAACLSSQRPYSAPGTLALIAASGERHSVTCRAAPVFDRKGALAGATVILAPQQAAVALVQTAAETGAFDDLTGLAGRDGFLRALSEAQTPRRPEQGEAFVTVITIDIPGSGTDGAGRLAADVHLRQIAERLAGAAAEPALLARIAPQGFALVLEAADATAALEQGEGLAAAIEQETLPWGDRTYVAFASIGMAGLDLDRMAEEVLAQAEAAAQVARSLSQGLASRVVVEERGASDAGEDQLQRLIAERRLRLFAQEIVDIRPRPAAGRRLELSVRAVGEDGSMVAPLSLLAVGERLRAGARIDQWVLAEGLERLGPALSRGGWSVLLRLSADLLAQAGAAELILSRLSAGGLSPNALTVAVGDLAALRPGGPTEALQQLQAAGCSLAIDNFGGGSAPFASLQRLTLDYLRIGQGFVAKINASDFDFAVVESLNSLAHRTGAQTIANGVADEAALRTLRQIGVDWAQGPAVSAARSAQALLGLETDAEAPAPERTPAPQAQHHP
ncbi:EAL domain-containing protein [Caulobacter sp. NIBR2454]|uniref:EAL domain-containing protein n=1 Tax=Caulobacter sp. NIBR2454 TaxID=3015996 RepID=UPI0022B61EB3|nr:EAL domain-containing protein [Caulobacter sp. NIBR2454]